MQQSVTFAYVCGEHLRVLQRSGNQKRSPSLDAMIPGRSFPAAPRGALDPCEVSAAPRNVAILGTDDLNAGECDPGRMWA